jgi:hypothetical protein
MTSLRAPALWIIILHKAEPRHLAGQQNLVSYACQEIYPDRLHGSERIMHGEEIRSLSVEPGGHPRDPQAEYQYNSAIAPAHP